MRPVKFSMAIQSPPAVNETRFAALSDGVTLMQANFTDHAIERHSHDCFSIGITTYGVQSFRCRGQRYNSQSGDFVLFNPDEDHDGSRGTDAGFRYTIWYVPADFVTSCLAVEGGSAGIPYFARPHVSNRNMAATFGRLSASLGAVPSETMTVESSMRTFLGALLCRYGERPGSIGRQPRDAGTASLARVKEYIQVYYQRDITVADLASIAGLSRAHLTRAFTAAYRTPPHVYLNAVRLARAKTLIRAGMPLADVAAACGYADQSHLTRRFKGSWGITPADWRKSMR